MIGGRKDAYEWRELCLGWKQAYDDLELIAKDLARKCAELEAIAQEWKDVAENNVEADDPRREG